MNSVGGYLAAKGWTEIGQRRNKYGMTRYWHHPQHQPDRHGAFTTTDAIAHQREADKYGCDCIPLYGEKETR